MLLFKLLNFCCLNYLILFFKAVALLMLRALRHQLQKPVL